MSTTSAVLEDTVTLLVSKYRRQLTRTGLMKLLYFVDLRSWERRGQGLTGLHWIWHYYGPYTKEVTEIVADLEGHEELNVKAVLKSGGDVIYRIHSGPNAGLYGALSEEERVIIEDVLQTFGHFTPNVLTELSYHTEPLIRAEARGDSLDFSMYASDGSQPAPFTPDPGLPRSPKMDPRWGTTEEDS